MDARSQVIARAVSLPIVTMEVPPPPYLASAELFFSATCRYSAHSSDTDLLAFSWFISAGDSFDPSRQVFSGSEVALHVPKNTLSAGSMYHLTLITAQGSGLPVTSSLSFLTSRSDLVRPPDNNTRVVFHVI